MGLRRPHHDIKSMVFQPGFRLLTSVFRVIILLEDHLRIFAPILKAFLELILKDADIEVGIHITINFAGIPHPIPPKAAPQHHMSTSKLDCSLYQPVTKAFPTLLPYPLPPKRPPSSPPQSSAGGFWQSPTPRSTEI